MKFSRILQFFTFAHLPKGKMQDTSEKFAILAGQLSNELPENPEAWAAFRKLLEAKDCAVRALIYKDLNEKEY